MKRSIIKLLCAALLACAGSACGNFAKSNPEPTRTTPRSSLIKGTFSSDSAYRYISEQVAFGPRVPGTESHEACAQYLIGKLRQFQADSIIVQKTTLTAYNGDRLPITNILAQYNPGDTHRILLVAHWDTRPWADNEADLELRQKPIDGANDGASGTAVLLEIARSLNLEAPSCGVDLLFVDAEDYGNSVGFGNNSDTWCLGSQYWVKNMPYTSMNRPRYGILLDMVGGKNARFHYETFSYHSASAPTAKVWSEAKRLGYDDIFINSLGGSVTDDHLVLTAAGIPTTDIIETQNEQTMTFPPTWHTHEDNLDNIDKKSLEAVGRTVLNVVYNENSAK